MPFADTVFRSLPVARPTQTGNIGRQFHQDFFSERVFVMEGRLRALLHVLRSRNPYNGNFEFDKMVAQADGVRIEDRHSLTR